MTDLDPNNYDEPEDYAIALAKAAATDPYREHWAVGGDDPNGPGRTETEYAIEPGRGAQAYEHDNELAGVIKSLPHYVDPRLIVREIHYGPWRYVTPEEIANG